jgi:hypothetical protein
MTHAEFHRLLSSVTALSPDEMRQLRDKLDHEIAEADARHATAIPTPVATSRKPIWEVFQELSASVPKEVWDALPPDLSEQHDHYIYGTPKHPVE